MHSEAVAHLTAQENGNFIQTFLCELEHPGLTAIELLNMDPKQLVPIVGCTDCEDLHATLIAAAPPAPTNKSLTLYLAALRELRETGRVEAYVWMDTRDMVSNPLTKLEADGRLTLQELGSFLRDGIFKISHPFKWMNQLSYD